MTSQELLNAQRQISVARTELKNIRMSMGGLQKLQKTYVKQIEEVMASYNDTQVVLTSKHYPRKQDQINVDVLQKRSELLQRDQLISSTGTEVSRPTENYAGINPSHVFPLGRPLRLLQSKNATPRQPTICMLTTATLELTKEFYSNPNHALDGLQEFSHIWLMFIFHKNDKQSYCKGKVAPPRLDGKRIGVFSTRSPHRPNPIGLSLVRLNKVEGAILHLSGIDAVDGTPVIDIKPYIPAYDRPNFHEEFVSSLQESSNSSSLRNADNDHAFKNHTTGNSLSPCEQNNDNSCKIAVTDLPTELQLHATELRPDVNNTDVTVPSWIDCPPVKQLTVHWTFRAKQGFCTAVSPESTIECEKFCEENETFKTITNILKEDPRSVYRRHQCSDQLYYFTFDFLHLTCWFDDSDHSVEIVKVCKLQNIKNKHE